MNVDENLAMMNANASANVDRAAANGINNSSIAHSSNAAATVGAAQVSEVKHLAKGGDEQIAAEQNATARDAANPAEEIDEPNQEQENQE